MKFTPGNTNPGSKSVDPAVQSADALLYASLEPIVRGLEMSLIELSVSRIKNRKPSGASSVQVKAVVMSKGITGLEDCSKVHRAVMPRLELAFPEQEIYLEVSSPGIDRLIKDANELIHYIGRNIKCYRTDISDWTEGVLLSADEEKLRLRKEDEEIVLDYEIIAKARLDAHQEMRPQCERQLK